MNKILQQALKSLLKIRPKSSGYRQKNEVLKYYNPYFRYSLSQRNSPQYSSNVSSYPTSLVIGLSLLSWLGFTEEDEDKESELIMTLKRAVLCKQREQFDKAEQMLHLALRIAQQQQNDQGIIYCYDLMANLAFDQNQLDKAETLFKYVLQILLGKGMKQESLEVIHISLKLARICQLKADLEKAEIGYKWCLEQIEKQKDDKVAAKILYGIISDWYAQFLLDKGDLKNALTFLNEAHKACIEADGKDSNQVVLLLNDMGITSFRAEDMINAEKFLTEAIAIGKNLKDKSHLGVVHANLGLVLLQKGILAEAQKFCKEAWQLGKRHENIESMEQANYCLDQIKLNMGK